MKRTQLLAAVAIAAFSFVPTLTAYADTITFTATLSGAFEVPPTSSTGTGFTTVVLNTTANTLFVDVSFSGLTSGATASHIHCCVASPFSNTNTGVATQVPSFINLPMGVTSGSFTQLLDLTLASSYNPAFITAEGGTVASAEAALVAGMEDGESYLNIHTTNFPGGEIRGLLAETPEPNSILLLGSGLVGLVCTRLRVRRKN
jgi:CHRD domain/PEP-CTERM motif